MGIIIILLFLITRCICAFYLHSFDPNAIDLKAVGAAPSSTIYSVRINWAEMYSQEFYMEEEPPSPLES